MDKMELVREIHIGKKNNTIEIKDQIQKEEEEAEETEMKNTNIRTSKKRSEKRIYEIVKRRLGPIDHGREKSVRSSN